MDSRQAKRTGQIEIRPSSGWRSRRGVPSSHGAAPPLREREHHPDSKQGQHQAEYERRALGGSSALIVRGKKDAGDYLLGNYAVCCWDHAKSNVAGVNGQ